MKEAKFLGTLLHSHPDLIPILNYIRGNYDLPEIDAEDNAIWKMFKKKSGLQKNYLRFSCAEPYSHVISSMQEEVAKKKKVY